MARWSPQDPGVIALPSGRLVRGRGLSAGVPAGPDPEFGLYLLGKPPASTSWPSRWVRWPDFRVPADPLEARDLLQDAWRRAAFERVEIACAGGRGRTGTALAALAVIDGLDAAQAIELVRSNYHPKAIETPGQRRFVRNFARNL